jgi:hypothetical protein
MRVSKIDQSAFGSRAIFAPLGLMVWETRSERVPVPNKGLTMATYRFIFLNPSGHVVDGNFLNCIDDLAALDKAHMLNRGHIVEVWQGTRHVAKVELGAEPLNGRDTASLKFG